MNLRDLRPPRLRCPRCEFRWEAPPISLSLEAGEDSIICPQCRIPVILEYEPPDERWFDWASRRPPAISTVARNERPPAKSRSLREVGL